MGEGGGISLWPVAFSLIVNCVLNGIVLTLDLREWRVGGEEDGRGEAGGRVERNISSKQPYACMYLTHH